MDAIGGADVRLPTEGRLPPLDGATTWLHSPPLTPESLRGKVVAADFCTYTCVNWLRTLPYVRAWHERYRDKGLVVLGIHTPEFSVEKDPENVRRALSQMGVTYPVALDNDYGVWDAFANRYWPALYLIDTEGRIRHHWFGEGDYERSERVIQRLLLDAGADGIDLEPVSVEGLGAEAGANWEDVRSPETYVGYGRSGTFRGRAVRDQRRVYEVPERLDLNDWAMSGEWTIGSEGALSVSPAASIAFRFQARDVNLVMGPVNGGVSIPFEVAIDGGAPGDGAGADVDGDGSGKLDEPRMYQLVRQSGTISPRLFEISFRDPGAEAFVFTFG